MHIGTHVSKRSTHFVCKDKCCLSVNFYGGRNDKIHQLYWFCGIESKNLWISVCFCYYFNVKLKLCDVLNTDILADITVSQILKEFSFSILSYLHIFFVSDIAIKLDGGRVMAHKCLLMVRCDPMLAMLGGHFRESSYNEVCMVFSIGGLFCDTVTK